MIALQIFHLLNGFRMIAFVLLKSLNSRPWSTKEGWRGLLWFFSAAGPQPCRKALCSTPGAQHWSQEENDGKWNRQEAGTPRSLEPLRFVVCTVSGPLPWCPVSFQSTTFSAIRGLEPLSRQRYIFFSQGKQLSPGYIFPKLLMWSFCKNVFKVS